MHLAINIVLVIAIASVAIWLIGKRRARRADDRVTRNAIAHFRNLLAEGVVTEDEVRKTFDDMVEEGDATREERDEALRQLLGG